VLVIPKRNTPRLANLNREEVLSFYQVFNYIILYLYRKKKTADLMISAQRIGNVVERHYKCTSLTMTIQDGPQAGQTVPHVHMHVIPRRSGDWANNDDIYKDLDEKKGVDNEEREPRTEEDMSKEANELRVYFESN
ncbi:hypothetical protein INT48_003917, partial [Thamnidium elegans]